MGADTPGARLHSRVLALYLGAVVVLVAYATTLFTRHSGHIWPLIDNQLVDAFEVVLALGCLGRGLIRKPGRGYSLALGVGLLAWAVGDIAWTLESSPSSPSLADAFYLLFYPLAYMALVLLLRSQVKQIRPSMWLDGSIAGLGAAAICTAFALDTILGGIGGTRASVAINLMYPIGDFVLLALAIAVVVIVPRHSARLMLFAAGCALMAGGDIIYLYQSSAGTYRVGTPLDLTWPAAMLAMSASVWLHSREAPRASLVERAPRLVILGLVSLACIVILVLGNVEHVNTVALALAGATLMVAGTRMTLSLRELRVQNEARRQETVTDELTGLGNRRRLLDELERALAALAPEGTQANGLALLLIDLDHFKEINDSFGHHTGDALLRQIGPRIRQVVRVGDLVARLGGDEFAVLLHSADVHQATTVARRITMLLEEPIDVDSASLRVGASIGVALAPEHALSAADLLHCADIAMYRAKNERGSFDIYEATLDDEADRIALIEDLRVAMNEGSLALHYQPEIDLRTGQVVTVEAFLRWPHPTLGLIPPEHLLALAEEIDLIRPLTAWVFEQAIADCARWWRDGHRVAVAVNLLATDLLDSALPRRVGELLQRAGLPPEALVLEITEGMVMADLTRSKRVIESLADSGILVSIDDFGTGFSSLSHLSDLAVGEVKLDRKFTSRLQLGEAGERHEDIVRSIIHLGHALGLRVVAEGIERIGFVSVLAGLGCDAGQGFAIQAPCPADEIDFAGFHSQTSL
ncbi:MAG: putative bifunctional diguanylate cyclase/phosphodiesterase [Acidimicrobiales bacterium]